MRCSCMRLRTPGVAAKEPGANHRRESAASDRPRSDACVSSQRRVTGCASTNRAACCSRLVGEVGELAKLYQWQTGEDPDPAHVRDEVADVLIYALRFADIAGVDVVEAVAEKIERNERRFPPRSRGEDR